MERFTKQFGTMNYLAKHTFKRWEGKKINQITSTMIRELFLDNRQIWSEHHRKSMRKHVKAVFEFALDAEFIPKNPMPKITCKTGQKLKAVLTEKQNTKALQESKAMNFFELKEHVFLSIRLGLSAIRELRFLKWEHIDYDNKLIFIKGSVTRSGLEKGTKTDEDRVSTNDSDDGNLFEKATVKNWSCKLCGSTG